MSRHLNIKLKLESWQCTAAQAATLGLPHSLEDVGKVLGLELQKIKEGKDLIRLFCKPNKTEKEICLRTTLINGKDLKSIAPGT